MAMSFFFADSLFEFRIPALNYLNAFLLFGVLSATGHFLLNGMKKLAYAVSLLYGLGISYPSSFSLGPASFFLS